MGFLCNKWLQRDPFPFLRKGVWLRETTCTLLGILALDILGLDIPALDILGLDILALNILGLDILALDILGLDILGFDILGLDILGMTRESLATRE